MSQSHVPHRLFVYGSLMSDFGHPRHRDVARHAVCLGRASMPGELYLVSWYPGAIYRLDSPNRVWGELYDVREAAPLFAVLDEYEGIGAPKNGVDEYRRAEVAVMAASTGEVVTAWTYLYQWPVDDLTRIASGVFSKA